MRPPRIFLDHGLTTPLRPESLAAMRPYFDSEYASPSALHAGGWRAREALELARAQLASLVHAESPENIVFTSGGTEAVNLAILGIAGSPRQRGRHLVLTGAEHPAVYRSAEHLQTQGFRVTSVPISGTGRVDPAAIRAALTEETCLICVHHVNHDLGTIQPVAEVGAVAEDRGLPLFVDATASAGWVPVDVQAMRASLVALAPHRFYGPKGVGVLYRHRRARLAPLLYGGEQEGGLRPGTENVPAIVGAGVAAEWAERELPTRQVQGREIQRRLWTALQAQIDQVQLNGPALGPTRAPNHLHLTIDGVEGEALVLALDLQGVAFHSGTACVTRSVKVPRALEAIGLTPAQVRSSILLAPGKDTTDAEADQAAERIATGVAKLRAMSM